MTDHGSTGLPSDEDEDRHSRRVVDVYPKLPRIASGLLVLSFALLGIGLVKLDRARRGLTPPSFGAHDEIVSPYVPVIWLFVGGSAGVAIAVLVLFTAYRRSP